MEKRPYLYIGLDDFNGDGVPELTLSEDTASASDIGYIYRITDGKVERFCSVTTSFSPGWISKRKK